MKYILRILFFCLLGILARGYYVKELLDYKGGEKIIGLGVLFGAFVYLPLFLYYRWKDKNIADYTLTDENMRKMSGKEKRKR